MPMVHRHGPATVCDFANVTIAHNAPKIVRVNTGDRPKWPDRDNFFDWFDHWRDEKKFKNDSEVAGAAGLNHSSISAWRSGRQRPNAFSLSDIARVFGRPAREAWARAGLLTEADFAEMVTLDAQEKHIREIRESSLSKVQQDLLIAMYREDMQRAADRVRQQIELLSKE